ncbi:FxSxx-COOH system tetratricopeptide repeat protein [Pseudofrankia inefficax]|uniref:FxSxx-COOH system tetratricopeptide repeat protein n=1 Tax=Pseudofrankia inefficax (strain DSM 45817 / CECT 9037 / DDB 130130 / EuI1c) TaxID=298654 RepID=UPI0018DF6353|nr:FxSxx-COOH system tetratricopeptide repeat protein [Pseudofrankia inefficax]
MSGSDVLRGSEAKRLPGGGVAERLTDEQVETLAHLITDPFAARQLVAAAGIPMADQPWSTHSPRMFWTEVSAAFANGAAVDGAQRLLTLARDQFPANIVLAGPPVFAPAGANTSPRPAVWNIPPRPARFVGRADLLTALAGHLSVGGDTPGIAAVTGMGGVGKTALAIEYAHRQRLAFDVVWWIPAQRAELLDTHLAALGQQLGLPADAKPLTVLAQLRRTAVTWLLVFDDVDDPATVMPYRPTDGHGRMLVTSRQRGWRGIGAAIDVPTLTRPESIALLTGHLPDADPPAANHVAELLGDLALAVEQAAAFCERTGIPLVDLAHLLVERLDEALALGEVVERPEVTVATLWDLSVRRLAAEQPAAVALLELLALCAPDPLPLDLLAEHAEQLSDSRLSHAVRDPLTWARTVGALVSYSLATRDDTTIWVHRLVQAATRRQMHDAHQEHLLADLLALLEADLPEDITLTPQSWPRWRLLLPHVRAALARASVPADRNWTTAPYPPATRDAICSLSDRTATYLTEHGRPTEALPLYNQSLAITETIHGRDNPRAAPILLHLASALRVLGRYREALPLNQRAVTLTETTFGTEDPRTGEARNNLAVTLGNLGRFDEALSSYEKALSIAEATYGPDDFRVSIVLGNMAGAFYHLKRTDQALPLIRRAAAITESCRGPDHPQVAVALNMLAMTLTHRRHHGEVIELLQRVLAINEAAYGPGHPEVAANVNNLALTLRYSGRAAEALPLFDRALAISEATFGPNHPEVARTQHNRALALADLGQTAEALALVRHALTIAEATYGPEHPYSAEARNNLGIIYIRHRHPWLPRLTRAAKRRRGPARS